MLDMGMRKGWPLVFFLVAMALVVVPAWSLEFPLFRRFLKSKNRHRTASNYSPIGPLRLLSSHHQVVMDNGIIQVTLSVPHGFITKVQYNNGDNVLDQASGEDERGYWDLTWNTPGSNSTSHKIISTKFQVIKQDETQIELSFSSTWSHSSDSSTLPLNIDKRFVMLPGQSGFYSYSIYERHEGWPDFDVDETRIVFRLNKNNFRYMAISDDRQRIMPLPVDRLTGKPLAYPEAVLLTNASDSAFKGEVDDKYQYSTNNKDCQVHGWISLYPPLGFWMITPSNEFRTGGPLKQDLTSHVGPVVLSMFVSLHYAGKSQGLQFRNGEPWKKVFGPVFVYLNSEPFDENPVTLWEDAKKKMLKETENWPYSFPLSEDFVPASKRGQVRGQLIVIDKYVDTSYAPAAFAQVGLAAQGLPGSWQTESKGYQFWTETDQNGNFIIKGVLPGSYNLYGWVPGTIGDFKHDAPVIIEAGSNVNLGVVQFNPPRSGPTLWEIGIPDRTAAEFNIPSPKPDLVNRLYLNQDRFRQYGLWARYTDLYPDQDLVYAVGTSDYRKDWFYAQVTRILGEKNYRPTTWQIIFNLETVSPGENYVLRLALASASECKLHVHINEPDAARSLFEAALAGRDNAIARHGIHGLYVLFSIEIPGSHLVKGQNTIFLTQSKSMTQFQGLMYDYIRLEGPSDNN